MYYCNRTIVHKRSYERSECMKTGLVLEGGAMRGIYTAGVLDVFMEENIQVDGIAGVSAGAIHGASYVSAQPGRNLRYHKKYCRDWRFMSMRSWVRTGDIVGYEFCYNTIPYQLDPFDFKRFATSKTEFFAGVTNIETGTAELLSSRAEKDLLANIHASASLPVVSRIVEIGDRKYLDGGIGDSIPWEAFKRIGYNRQIVVLTRPEGYRKRPDKLMPIIRMKYRKYPKFIEACKRRHLMYNETVDKLEEAEKRGEIILIRPSRRIRIKRTEKNPEVLQAQYDLGRQDALKRLDDVREYLSL